MDIEKCTLEELRNLYRKISQEIDKRRNQEKEDDWNEVVNVIYNYVEKYGDITVYTDIHCFYIGCDTNFKNAGQIRNNEY